MKSEKTTEPSEHRIGRRIYDDLCGSAHALELIGERWAPLVMRELMLGPKRFRDLRAGLPGLSATVLTQRLEKLLEVGLVTRRALPPPASAHVYELTAWGYDAEPWMNAMGRWASRSPLHDGAHFSPVSLALSMRTNFDPEKAQGFAARIALHVGGEELVAEVADGAITVARDDGRDAAATLSGPPLAFAGVLYAGAQLDALIADGTVTAHGDVATAARLLTLFSLPPKAPKPERKDG